MIAGQDNECDSNVAEDQYGDAAVNDGSNESNERKLLLLHHRPTSRLHFQHDCSSSSDIVVGIPNKARSSAAAAATESTWRTSKAKRLPKCSAFLLLMAVMLLSTIFGFFSTSWVLHFDVKSKLQSWDLIDQQQQQLQQQLPQERDEVQEELVSERIDRENYTAKNRNQPTKTNFQHSSDADKSTTPYRDDLPNYLKPSNPPDFVRHWTLTLSSVDSSGKSGGEANRIQVNCTISIIPDASTSSFPSLISLDQPTSTKRPEQYLIHIHGLHHTGTGEFDIIISGFMDKQSNKVTTIIIIVYSPCYYFQSMLTLFFSGI